MAAPTSRSTRRRDGAEGINPLTERVLDDAGLDHSWARSKSVTEYLGQTFDYVITVCDQAREVCPVFPGVHETLHWGYEDPAAVEGSEEQRLAEFRSTLTMMSGRILSFITLARRDRAGPSRGRLAPMADRDTVQLHLLRHAHAGDPEGWDGPRRCAAAIGQGRAAVGAACRIPRGRFVQTGRDHHVTEAPRGQTAEIVARALGIEVRRG